MKKIFLALVLCAICAAPCFAGGRPAGGRGGNCGGRSVSRGSYNRGGSYNNNRINVVNVNSGNRGCGNRGGGYGRGCGGGYRPCPPCPRPPRPCPGGYYGPGCGWGYGYNCDRGLGNAAAITSIVADGIAMARMLVTPTVVAAPVATPAVAAPAYGY